MEFKAPSTDYIGTYNPEFFQGIEDVEKINSSSTVTTVTSGDYLFRDGSNIMTGNLLAPKIILYSGDITFPDNTVQLTAFLESDRNQIDSNQAKLQNVTYNEVDDNISISNSVRVAKIIFSDDSEQIIAFIQQDKTNIDSNTQKVQNIEYDEGLTKLTINDNCYINNLTCGNFNVAHLTSTSSNLQSQITNNQSNITYLDGRIDTEAARATVIEDVNTRQDTSLNVLDSSFNEHIIDYNSNINRIDTGLNELYTLNNTNLNTNTRQDTSLNTLFTFKDNTEAHLDTIDSSLNSLQSSNIVNIENDILQLQTKTENIETTTNGLKLTHIFECRDIILNNISSQISFGDGSLQGTAYTDSLHTKLSNMPTINNISKLGCSYIGNGTVNNTEFSHLENVTSNIQDQFNNVQNLINQINTNSGVTNYETSNIPTLLNTAISTGQWFGETETTWIPVSTYTLFANTLYHFNLQFVTNYLTELKVMMCRITIRDTNTNALYDQTEYHGVYLDEQTSKEPRYSINTQLYYKNTTQKAVKIQVDTTYHFKPNFNCTFKAKIQVARLN